MRSTNAWYLFTYLLNSWCTVWIFLSFYCTSVNLLNHIPLQVGMYYGSGTVNRKERALYKLQMQQRAADGRCCIVRPPFWRRVCQMSDSISRCVFTWRAILPNFIPIQFEATDLGGFSEECRPNKKYKKNKMGSDMKSVPDSKISLRFMPEATRICFNSRLSLQEITLIVL